MTSRLEQLVERFADGRNTRFAKLLETNEARIRSYLTGSVQPKYDFLEAVSEKLGVSIDWLISGEGRMLRAENRAEREAKKKAQRELEQEGLPVFDCDFTCGFDDVENDQPRARVTLWTPLSTARPICGARCRVAACCPTSNPATRSPCVA